jgi:outer membrane lipoprotein-sorting protein
LNRLPGFVFRIRRFMENLRVWARRLLFCGLVAALAACSTTKPPPIVPETLPDERRPIDDLLQTLARRDKELTSLRSLASVYYNGPDARQSFQEVVVVKRPDRLRLETLYPLGVLMIVTASPEDLTVYHTREGVFYHGKSDNLWRFTRIPLNVAETASLLMGLPPGTKGQWRHEGPTIVRDAGGGWKETVAFQQGEPLPIRWQLLNPSGGVELVAEFGDYTQTAAGPFPIRIALENPTQKRRIEVTYKDPEVNADLPPTLFVQKKPDNAREVALDSTGS